jgi:AcrR family transcriptional regulator
MASASTRMTADERRASVVAVAREEFARGGFHGTSTERIAERAGVSQPYLFRLFGTKKHLFLACVQAGFETVLHHFERAAEGLSGDEALRAMGDAYLELLQDRTLLQAQMQSYAAAADDPEVRAAVREGFGNIVGLVDRVSGVDAAGLSRFMAKGMLLSVVAAMDLLESDDRWARRVLEGCREDAS